MIFAICLQSDLEDSQEKNRSMQVILDNSYKWVVKEYIFSVLR